MKILDAVAVEILKWEARYTCTQEEDQYGVLTKQT